jgi:hypothetical protein
MDYHEHGGITLQPIFKIGNENQRTNKYFGTNWVRISLFLWFAFWEYGFQVLLIGIPQRTINKKSWVLVYLWSLFFGEFHWILGLTLLLLNSN